MYRTMSSLPRPEALTAIVDLSGSGKQQWGTNKTGYMNWVLGQLLTKGAIKEGMGHDHEKVDKVDLAASEVGTRDELWRALDAVGAMKRDLTVVLPPEGDANDR